MPTNYIIPANIALDGNWPSDIFNLLGEIPIFNDLLGKIGVSYLNIHFPANIEAAIQFRNELSIEIPGIQGLAMIFGTNVPGITEITLALNLSDPFLLRLSEFPVRLRFPRNILQPVVLENDLYVPDPDETKTVDIGISPSITFDGTGEVGITGTESIEVTSVFMIGDTGFVVDLPALDLVLNDQSPFTPDGEEGPHLDWPTDFRGVWIPHATMYYHKAGTRFSPTIELLNVGIGTGGFTGAISLGEYARRHEDIATAVLNKESPLPPYLLGINADDTELNEMQVIFQYFGITFEQSIPIAGEITGYLFMPFTDKWMKFMASIGGPNGDFMLEIGGTADAPLISLENELFEIKADSIAYKQDDGIHYAIISGSIKPKIPGFDWPELKIEDLSVSSEGDISIPGGWITAPEEITLDFSAFKIGISEIGFGNEEVEDNEALKRQWLGFSGSLNLVEGLELKASVEGLKFSWLKQPNPDPEIGKDLHVSLTGIAVEFEIPNTLSFKGALSYETLTEENNGGTGLTGKLFKGNIKLNLMAVRLEIDAQLMIGKLKDADGHEFTTFFIVLGIELPAGIPLGATGTSLYGIKGLAALHAATTKTEGQNWYEWSKAEPEGVTSIDKWKPLYDEYGFGAGVTLGTAYDDGYTLNMRVMLVVLLPGPVIILEGKANLLKQRSEDKKEEGLFYLLAVLDGRAGTFMLNIDVKYSLSDVITVGASVEAFFDFHSSDNWYLHIGKDEPVEKRIRAEILSLFGANAYFMIDSRSFKTGASIGWDLKKTFGPVSFALVARMSFDAAIFWKPVQLEGALEMYGEVALKVFGIGIELYLRMFLEGKAPRPYWIHGIAAIGIKLFWPLPDLELEVEFEWKQPEPIEPVWPLLKECSFIHHKDSSATWALPIETDNISDPASIENITILPVDSRPVLTFARPVHNLQRHAAEDGTIAPIMSLAQDNVGGKLLKYNLNEIRLEEWKDGAWNSIRNGINTGVLHEEFTLSKNSFLNFKDNVEPNEPQIQLWQYSIEDRENIYQREDYNDHHPACSTRIERKWMEVNWKGVAHNHEYDYNFEYADLTFVCDETATEKFPTVHDELLHASSLYVYFPKPVTTVQVIMSAKSSQDRIGYVISDGSRVNDMTNTASGLLYHSTSPINSIRIMGTSLIISNIVYMTETSRITYDTSRRPDHRKIEEQNTDGELFLEPNVYYRIKTETSVNIDGRAGARTENFVYFKTDKGPGVTLPGLNKDPEEQTEEEKLLATQIASYNAKTFHQFASYIDRTLPVDGAKTFYSGYDMGIQFNEAYVKKLYANPIKMIIRDRNGKTLEESLGTFLDGFFPLLKWGLLGWLKAKDDGECADPEQPEIPAPYLNFRTTLPFKLNSLYMVDLVTETPGSEHVLHKFQFTTSRYRNFTEHILSPDKVKTIETIALPAITLAKEIPLGKHSEAVDAYDSRLARYNGSSGALNKYAILTEMKRRAPEMTLAADKTFDQLDAIANRSFAKINMQNRPSAEKFEIFKIRIAKEDKFILLLESPEPIAWERITAKAIEPTENILGFVWNNDKTRSFLYHSKGHLFNKGNYTFSFIFSGDPDPVTGVILRGGLVVNEEVDFKLEL